MSVSSNEEPSNSRWGRPGLLTLVLPAGLLTVSVLVLGLSRPAQVNDFGFKWADKVQHTVAFIIVGYSYFRAAKQLYPYADESRRRLASMSAAIGLGAVLEVLQSQLPYRSAEWLDLVADALGVGIAMLGVRLIDRPEGSRRP